MSDNPFVDPPAQPTENAVAIPSNDTPTDAPATSSVSVPAATAQEPDKQDPDNGMRTTEDRFDVILRDIALVLLCSGFLMAESARECDDDGGCSDNQAWGVACGCICSVVCMIWIFLVRFGPGKSNPASFQGLKVQIVCAFLWAMYVGAAGVLTFDGPYTTTGNGYFFSWGGFVASTHAVYLAFDFIHNWIHASKAQVEMVTMEKRMIAACLLASLIEMIESCVMCDKHDCTDKLGYGIAMGVIGLIYCAVLLALYAKLANIMPWLALGLSVAWGVAAVVLTFKGGPYNVTGNGYFSAWAAFVSAFGLTFLTSRHLVAAKLAALEGPSSNAPPTGSAEPSQSPGVESGGEVPAIPPAGSDRV